MGVVLVYVATIAAAWWLTPSAASRTMLISSSAVLAAVLVLHAFSARVSAVSMRPIPTRAKLTMWSLPRGSSVPSVDMLMHGMRETTSASSPRRASSFSLFNPQAIVRTFRNDLWTRNAMSSYAAGCSSARQSREYRWCGSRRLGEGRARKWLHILAVSSRCSVIAVVAENSRSGGE